MTAECVHDLDPAWCSLCLRRDAPAAAATRRRVTAARFGSSCGWCGRWIDEGDLIVAGDDGGWEHAECGQ